MRHAPVTFAERWRDLPAQRWDVLLASDMLDLATFRGLVPLLAAVPAVLYFHENQLTYPVRRGHEGDGHFAFTNLTSALAARELWFNSAFHRDELMAAWDGWLRRFPDHQPLGSLAGLASRLRVEPPGIAEPWALERRSDGSPLRVLWAARWEHDKAPETFFAGVEAALDAGADLELSVLGESFRDQPPVFEQARQRWGGRIRHWGWLEEREAYQRALAEADVFVSTARHEFFGLSAVEAVAAGAFPLLPRRLAYPEVFADFGADSFYGSGIPEDEGERLAQRLVELEGRHRGGSLWQGDRDRGRRAMARYSWSNRAPALDRALEVVADGSYEDLKR